MYLILFVRMTSATSSEEANALIRLGKQWGGVFAVRETVLYLGTRAAVLYCFVGVLDDCVICSAVKDCPACTFVNLDEAIGGTRRWISFSAQDNQNGLAERTHLPSRRACWKKRALANALFPYLITTQ